MDRILSRSFCDDDGSGRLWNLGESEITKPPWTIQQRTISIVIEPVSHTLDKFYNFLKFYMLRIRNETTVD